MSDETEALARWWVTFDGPAYPTGMEMAEALFASDWLAEHDAEVEARVREEIAQAIEGSAPSAGDAYARERLGYVRQALLSAARIARGGAR